LRRSQIVEPIIRDKTETPRSGDGRDEKKDFAMTLSIPRPVLAVGLLVLGHAGFVVAATPVSAALVGDTTSCSISSTTATCSFPVLSAAYNAEIHYVTAQCSSTGVAYNLKQLAILATPPGGTATISYQFAGNRASVAGVANAAAIVEVTVKENTTVAVQIQFSVVPTGTTTCTASMTFGL
jgi:hypothetical protein